MNIIQYLITELNYPKGLISYTSEAKLAGKSAGPLRAKIISYAVLSLIVISGMVATVVNTVAVELSISRDRNVLYRINDNDDIETSYQLKILNKSSQTMRYQLKVTGLVCISSSKNQLIEVASGELLDVVLTLTASPEDIKQPVTKLTFIIEANDNPDITVSTETRFFAL